jgi:hypothetical protein
MNSHTIHLVSLLWGDHVRRSLPKGYSRSARLARMSQVTAGMKREHNLGLEERIRTKEIKTELH